MATQGPTTVRRLVHYYNLLVGLNPNFQYENSRQPFWDVFKTLENQLSTGPKTYISPFNNKTFVIPEIKLNNRTGFIEGRLFAVRDEDMPSIYNRSTAQIRELEATEHEGIVETTHFVIDYKKQDPIVGFEYNQYGAKITDLCRYIDHVCKPTKPCDGIGHGHVLKNELAEYIQRMGELSEFLIQVHTGNIQRLQALDEGLATTFSNIAETYGGEYATLKVKFDYRNGMPQPKGLINKLIGKLVEDPRNSTIFDTLDVKAEDIDKNNKLNGFDLLVDKVKSELFVQKRDRSRTIVSTDILQQMNDELFRLHL
ncbi:hypothetical protein QNI16_07330 [Cytophagaceae bacterium YF14B1]|uniref:Uncharacterized protein n=1 Tax=Xanthocytophaga flava TaxID=3048013 RepID=A0AAE3QKH7_9BACT|nr:hypothetical protein [Xanthocytophaga flavus]MDJ1480291.1 hypothetical protein [Xanthocytophaga flavus]